MTIMYFINEGVNPDTIFGDLTPTCISENELDRLEREFNDSDLPDSFHEATAEEIAEHGAYDGANHVMIPEIFTDYVKTCLFPGDFYQLSEDIWEEVLDEIAEFFTGKGMIFQYSPADIPTIKKVIDLMFDKELGRGE